ncbi:MAG: type I methionyl aminopeptidase [Amoebophilaceae bacterium]|jgi:methionyl aminopeptidase|nr:type I methionyl aminopeptidase [Amoebophilaceae bacterium]
MGSVKREEEVALIRKGAKILSKTQGQVAKEIKPGVTTQRLDALAEAFIRDSGGVPSFKGYQKFPATLCTSVNEYVVHGLPSGYVLQEGDIVSVDCGVYYKGFHSDAAFTYPVGVVSDEVMCLLRVTKEALYCGINEAKVGNRVGDVGYAIQRHAQDHGYSVVRELVGHGVGRALHEDPPVPNYGRRGHGAQLRQGMVLAIEPMINLGGRQVVQEKGGVFRSLDRKATAHFEHTVVVLEGKAEILTTYRYIEEVFKF